MLQAENPAVAEIVITEGRGFEAWGVITHCFRMLWERIASSRCCKRIATEGIVVRSSNYTLYGDMSARVMQVLARFSPVLEDLLDRQCLPRHGGFERRLQAHGE